MWVGACRSTDPSTLLAFHYLGPPAMLMLLVALGSQVPAPCPHAAAACRDTAAGWQAYRSEAIPQAATHFAAADFLCPGDHATQIRLGFVLLRQSQPRRAAGRFLLTL